MKVLYAIAVVSVLAGGSAEAKDGLDLVRCGGDVAATLRGTHISNGPAVETEARHKAIGLKDLGADELTDDLSGVSWQICGKDYLMLMGAHDIARDVLEIPAHSRLAPEFAGGPCKKNGKDSPALLWPFSTTRKALPRIGRRATRRCCRRHWPGESTRKPCAS
jgi:hypothetical protein